MIICLDTSTCGTSIQQVSLITNDPDTPILSFMVTGTVIQRGDFDGDGVVGINDFLELLANWGPCPSGPCPWDIASSAGGPDGLVGINDFLELLANWGPCP